MLLFSFASMGSFVVDPACVFLKNNRCPSSDEIIFKSYWRTVEQQVLTQCLTSRQSTIFAVTGEGIGVATPHHQLDRPMPPGETITLKS
jgi:hypothetical protein